MIEKDFDKYNEEIHKAFQHMIDLYKEDMQPYEVTHLIETITKTKKELGKKYLGL